MLESVLADAGVTQLVDCIYQTIRAPETWAELIQKIGDWLDADCGLMLSPALPGVNAAPLFAYGLDMTPIMAAYPKYAGRAEFTHRALATGRTPGAFLLDELMPPDEQKTNEFWRDMVAPTGLTSGIFAMVRNPDEGDRPVILNYYRRAPKPPFVAADVARMEALLPHLRRALAVTLDGPPRRELQPGLTDLYESIGAPCLLLDAQSTVIYANHAAEQLLGARDGLELENGALKLWDENAGGALQIAIDRLVREPWSGRWRMGGEVLARRPSRAAAMVIVITPVANENAIAAVSSPARCAILILEEQLRSNGKLPDRLRRLYSLTDAETDIVIRLSAGDVPAAIAAARRTSVDTVRVQIKAAMNKTGVHRQAELTALVNRLSF
jgi:DNA-binding CsgD family transcriptional regulator/PAS domain-containing protein